MTGSFDDDMDVFLIAIKVYFNDITNVLVFDLFDDGVC